MPTYAFTTMKNLNADQKRCLVRDSTKIHAEEARAPRYFVQVVFYTVEPGSMFIGGEAASDNHVWVRADIRSGRTDEQKGAIMKRLMKAASDTIGVPEENVWVYISDIPASGVAEYGAVLPQPGEEASWLAALPRKLSEKLASNS